MNLNEFSHQELQIQTLNNEDILSISGGDSPFYDAGVAVGVGIVRFCRWYNDLCIAAAMEE